MDLEIKDSEEYFNVQNIQEPTEKQRELVESIIALEVSIYLIRRTSGGYGFYADVLANLRRDLITEHDELFSPSYETFNDFY